MAFFSFYSRHSSGEIPTRRLPVEEAAKEAVVTEPKVISASHSRFSDEPSQMKVASRFKTKRGAFLSISIRETLHV